MFMLVLERVAYYLLNYKILKKVSHQNVFCEALILPNIVKTIAQNQENYHYFHSNL